MKIIGRILLGTFLGSLLSVSLIIGIAVLRAKHYKKAEQIVIYSDGEIVKIYQKPEYCYSKGLNNLYIREKGFTYEIYPILETQFVIMEENNNETNNFK